MKVTIGGTVSESRFLDKGMPQGSVLSPLLFNVMLHDLINGGNVCDTSLFADDTTVTTQSKTCTDAIGRVQPFIANLANRWKLTFSAEKSAVVVFSRKKGLNLIPS